MTRRVYIVKEDADMDEAIATATLAGIGEVVRGVPPRLRQAVADHELPVVYEDVLPAPVPDRFERLEQRLDDLDTRLKAIAPRRR